MNIINPVVQEYVNKYYRPQNDALNALREECEGKRIPIILKSTETMLSVILKTRSPKRILEIGTAVGYSTIFFANICGQCKITTIERNEESYEEALKNISAFGLEKRVNCLCGDAMEIITTLVQRMKEQNLEPFDFIFIDASKSQYKDFWENTMKLTHDGGLIVCDNVLLKGSTASSQYDVTGRHKTNIKRMREFIEYIKTQECAETYLLSEGDGLTVSIKRNLT
ncbi:MAG: O-methyltransferase [Eubacteriales bacterium]|nr:O-methyltransferase [Eubacteriales bacterium]MDD4389468.1 O-methyltransferase [Eubacteriales bacterium]